GLATVAQIEGVIGPIDGSRHSETNAGRPLASPGLMNRHYCPQTLLQCVERKTIAELRPGRRRIGLLTVGNSGLNLPPECIVVSMPERPEEYSARLYAVLHEMDARGVDHIVVELPPDEPAWLAVRDRLLRASVIV